jgi:hypothetical protein
VQSLQRIENFFEQLVEGSIGRLFRSPIQPAEIAKKLERAMEENYVVAVDGVIVPNIYDVLLHPRDLAGLASSRAALIEQMEQWLYEVAREERYRFVGPVRVRLLSEEGIARRVIQIRVATVDDVGEPAAPVDDQVFTRDYQVVRTADGTLAYRLKVLTGLHAGQVFIVGGALATIGRALDNDIVLETPDVSRHHARLEQTGGVYRLVDLQSTNGTLLNGRRVATQVLASGDVLTLGATEVAFEVSSAPEVPPRGQGDTGQRR